MTLPPNWDGYPDHNPTRRRKKPTRRTCRSRPGRLRGDGRRRAAVRAARRVMVRVSAPISTGRSFPTTRGSGSLHWASSPDRASPDQGQWPARFARLRRRARTLRTRRRRRHGLSRCPATTSPGSPASPRTRREQQALRQGRHRSELRRSTEVPNSSATVTYAGGRRQRIYAPRGARRAGTCCGRRDRRCCGAFRRLGRHGQVDRLDRFTRSARGRHADRRHDDRSRQAGR